MTDSERISSLEGRVKELEGELRRVLEILDSEALDNIMKSMRDRDAKRNRSSASVREMTDDDAVRVLVGDLADLNHRDAALAVGLTYSQVYSCRGGFTFKHVRKQLKNDGKRSRWD